MNRKVIRIAAGAAVLVLLVGGGVGAAVVMRWDRVIVQAEPELRASTDAVLIERGRYLAYGPAHCAYCHTPEDQWSGMAAGAEPPLSGGWVMDLPLAWLPTPNLTPDAETGIGRYTDGEIARMLRHNVRANGQLAVPVMEFENMSDEDVVALLSFLRSQPAVHNEVPERRLTSRGKVRLAFVLKPVRPAVAPPRWSPAPGATLERGEYLATAVAGCAACHTKRSPKDGGYAVPRFAGGQETQVLGDPKRRYVTPNLTPDPKTGQMADWTETEFVARFRAGTLNEGTLMPWEAFGRMSDDDLRAIYRFLQSLEPVEHDTGPMVRLRR
jgi:mono/diheme cytochrome c family protein